MRPGCSYTHKIKMHIFTRACSKEPTAVAETDQVELSSNLQKRSLVVRGWASKKRSGQIKAPVCTYVRSAVVKKTKNKTNEKER